LAARVHRPGAGGIQLHVGPPVVQSLARFFDLLVRQRQVVMRVGVGGSELQGGVIRLDGLVHAAGLIQNVAQIEVRQRVTRIDLDGAAVVFFRQRILPPVVAQSSQIDVRRCVLGVEFQNIFIRRNRHQLLAGIFFEGDPAREKLGHILGSRLRSFGRNGSAGNHLFLGSEIEHKLSGDRLQHLAFMTEGYPMPGGKGPGLEQRIFHARRLLLHGLQRLPDDGRAHLAGAQVPHLFHLQEIEEGIVLGRRDQPGFFPHGQLAGREPKNAK
jgi:hypothetical protein